MCPTIYSDRITTTTKVLWSSPSLTHSSDCPPISSIHIALYVWSPCITKLKTTERNVAVVINRHGSTIYGGMHVSIKFYSNAHSNNIVVWYYLKGYILIFGKIVSSFTIWVNMVCNDNNFTTAIVCWSQSTGKSAFMHTMSWADKYLHMYNVHMYFSAN